MKAPDDRPAPARVATPRVLNKAAMIVRDLSSEVSPERSRRNAISADLSMLAVLIELLYKALAGCGTVMTVQWSCTRGALCDRCTTQGNRYAHAIAFAPEPVDL